MSYYTCNGSPKGCERERFGQCGYHDEMKTFSTYSVTYEVDGSICCRLIQTGGIAEAVENVLKDYEHANILAVVNTTAL